MAVKTMIPRRDDDTLRIDDSDELVVVENFGGLQVSNLVYAHARTLYTYRTVVW